MIRKNRTEKKFSPQDVTKMSLAACLNRIFKKVEIEGLSDEANRELQDDIAIVASKMGVGETAAVILSAILERSKGSGCDEEDLANFLGCTNIEFIDFLTPLHELGDMKIIRPTRGRRKCYTVSEQARKAIEENSDFVPLQDSGLSTDELFTRFRMEFSDYHNDLIDDDRLLEDISSLLEKNQQLLFCRKALESALFRDCSESERRMFFYMCHRYVSFGEDGVSISRLEEFMDYMEDCQRFKRNLTRERTALQKGGLASFGNSDGFFNEDELSLSDGVKNDFFKEIELFPEHKVNHKDLILSSSIKAKELFYNPDEQRQVDRLAELLDDDNFGRIQERLEAKGMPKGFCCIFHGAPGSGKTASLYELARRTGRDIYFVNISQMKSKWVGESEKLTKQVFSTYRNMVKTCKKAPILAFNEADAIFNKRLSRVDGSADQMSNAVTDIILNELETLDGILIATTNLVGNMMGEGDNAMERRFLYKVEFNNPAEDVRARIWKSKIPSLDEKSAETLAGKYEFSGGNIENIARKSEVEFILSGREPGLETLDRYCEEELVNKQNKSKRIGFNE